MYLKAMVFFSVTGLKSYLLLGSGMQKISVCSDLREWIKESDFNQIFLFHFPILILFSMLQTMTINGVSAVIKFQKA